MRPIAAASVESSSAVEYVVAHELAHVGEPHHNDRFWARVERVLPDYAARKLWLVENGARF